jgi:hypothetical protein
MMKNGGKVYYILNDKLNNNLIKIIQQYNIKIRIDHINILDDIKYVGLNLKYKNSYKTIISNIKQIRSKKCKTMSHFL